jgi:hypothetical protein
MKRAIAAVCIVLLAACNEEKPAPNEAATDADAWLTQELGWVEGADPAERVAQDRAQNNLRFLSVCSLGCAIVGVSDITVRMCYPNITVAIVDKTTEAVQSERHAALKKEARAFAETYNRLMADQLKASGGGACPPPVDWDAAYNEIVAVLDRTYTGGFHGDVSLNERRHVFQIRLPRAVTREDVNKPLCEIVARNGLRDRAILEVKGVDTQEDYAALSC